MRLDGLLTRPVSGSNKAHRETIYIHDVPSRLLYTSLNVVRQGMRMSQVENMVRFCLNLNLICESECLLGFVIFRLYKQVFLRKSYTKAMGILESCITIYSSPFFLDTESCVPSYPTLK